MEIHILAGGPQQLLPNLENYDCEETIWIGVDRGALFLMKEGIEPHHVFGDYDSVTVSELEEIKKTGAKMHTYEKEKDATDLALALAWALEQGARKIRIFGATGGRLDHHLANIYLLLHGLEKSNSQEIELLDQQNLVFLKQPGSYTLAHDARRKYVSFIPFTTSVENITLRGFKYDLQARDVPLGSTLCISNEIIEKIATYSFSKGTLLVIRSSDN